jgi:LysR family transcriptional repressor of citA
VDLDILKTYAVAAQLLNFRLTAERLYITQPTVTAHIKKLENELRCQLFERSGRGIRLTEEGKSFLPDALAVIERYQAAVTTLANRMEGRSQDLIIAASPLVARTILPTVIRKYTQTNPEVDVVVEVVDSERVGEMVAGGKANVGLSRINNDEPKVQSRVLYRDPVLLIASGDRKENENPPVDWMDILARKTLLVKNHPIYWDEILTELYARNMHFNTLAVSDVDITKHFIEEGIGISFLPLSAVSRELSEGRLMEVPTLGLQTPVSATYTVEPVGSTSIKAAKRFLNLLRSYNWNFDINNLS